jgi:uncharacterized protein
MRRVFVDTGAWFAFFVASDPDHHAVAEALSGWEGRLLTTDYVFDELVTLVRYRATHGDARRVGDALRAGSVAELIGLQRRDIDRAWERFVREPDKRYSFTDCTSFALMNRLGLDTAVAVDDHFRQAGFVVLPAD